MTPFEKAGYTSETKFRVLVNYLDHIKRGDIVTIADDDDSHCPFFITEDGRRGFMFLPGDSWEELEVINEEEPSKTLYSIYPDDWIDSSPQDKDIIDQNWDGESGTFTLYAAELKEVKASDLFTTKALCDLIDSTTDAAYDKYGECAEDWDFEAGKLKNELKSFIEEWFDKNKCQPSFFGVENVRPITYKVWMIDENSFDYCEVKNEQE